MTFGRMANSQREDWKAALVVVERAMRALVRPRPPGSQPAA
jgi:hypothetical protein